MNPTTTIEITPAVRQTLAALGMAGTKLAYSVEEAAEALGLGRTMLYDRFAPNIFSASQVDNGKPAPDLFLFAAEQMNVPPERGVVIEDSVPGVIGGRAAGMPVIGFHGGSHCRPGYGETLRKAGAAILFDDMRQLPELIAQMR